jgi:hypothetical protein
MLLVLPVFAATWLGGSGVARACKCAPTLPVREAIAVAAAVFEGRVVAVSLAEGAEEGTAYHVDFALLRALKGVPSTTRLVTLRAWRGGCELPFVVGRSYVVYASRATEDILTTNVCSRTRESAVAAEDLAAFPPAQRTSKRGSR